jgi:hypothetical protein
MKTTNKKIRPSFGYQFSDGDAIDVNNETELRELAMNMSHSPKFKEEIARASHKELIEFFKENGFIFE